MSNLNNIITKPIVNVIKLGLKPFCEALKIQSVTSNTIISQIRNEETKIKNTLILVEHNPVYTVGIRTKNYTKEDEIKLSGLGAKLIKTNRGGLITFHGPGQLVAYPILYLKCFDLKNSMRCYISALQKTIIGCCNKYNLNAATTSDVGVWIGNNKIAAIGVHGSRYVTSHGVAINCNTDLSWFDHIVPCGIPDKGVTSLSQELNRNVTIEETIPVFLNSFKNQFNCEFIFEN